MVPMLVECPNGRGGMGGEQMPNGREQLDKSVYGITRIIQEQVTGTEAD